MNDLISRQAAIDAIQREARLAGGSVVIQYADMFEYVLKQLPSAQPERKKGQWCEHYSHEDGEHDGVQCSECGTHYYFGGQLMNFCPNCGARMEDEQGKV